MTEDRDSRRRAIATAGGLVVGATAYLLTLLDYSTRLTRTANALGYASNFFDFQARAFLDGHLWVPRGTLGIEGFIQDGREYMYFAPFPALLRLPVLMTTHEFDGKLTLLSMGLAFVLMAVMTAKLVWLVRDVMYLDAPVTPFEAASMTVLLAAATGGTSLTFNAALPWVYHEVYAWAVPLVVGSLYWMLRVLRSPEPQSVAWLAAFALCTVLTRTTGGWAVCLVSLAIGVWLLTGRLQPVRRRVGWAVVAAGAVPLAVGIAYNVAKFRHPFLFPLEDQVWTELNAHRREVLAANGGTLTGPQFFPTSFMAYFRPDGIRFVDYFPWITLPAAPARSYQGAMIDQSYRTGSVAGFMPWLLALTVLAVLVLFRPGVDAGRRMLRAPLVAGVLVSGGVMAYGYLAYRYTCEFVPALVIGGAVGTCALTHWVQRRPRWLAFPVLGLAAGAAAFSIAANMLTGYTASALTSGGPELARYLDVQRRLSPDAQRGLIVQDVSLPDQGSVDNIHIQGDCDAVYLDTGDAYQRWQLVERRSTVVTATLDRRLRATKVPLVRIATRDPRSVWLETDDHDRARVLIVHGEASFPGPWFSVLKPRVIRVGVRDRADLGYAEVSSNPGGWVGYIRAFDWDRSWISHPIAINLAVPDEDALDRAGIHLRVERGIEPPLCSRLRVGS